MDKIEREQRKAAERLLGHKVSRAELRALRVLGVMLALYVVLKPKWGPDGLIHQ